MCKGPLPECLGQRLACLPDMYRPEAFVSPDRYMKFNECNESNTFAGIPGALTPDMVALVI